MGGAAEVMRKAKASFDAGDFRWTAQVLDHVVFADPKNDAARFMLADALEQLGYQAESGPWRGFYLTGAMELRKGVRDLPAPNTASADVVAGMTPEMFLDFMAVRLDPKKAAGKKLVIDFEITGEAKPKEYTVTLQNSVLGYVIGKPEGAADVKLSLDVPTLNAINAGKKLSDAAKDGKAKISGDRAKFEEFLTFFETPGFWFPIVTP
jgi:alkyl sulfatase BDS1-like metallo-beta-lactamase superfamily hydrolase